MEVLREQIRIKVGYVAVLIGVNAEVRIPSHTSIEGQSRAHLPGILCVETNVIQSIVPYRWAALGERGRLSQHKFRQTQAINLAIECKRSICVEFRDSV